MTTPDPGTGCDCCTRHNPQPLTLVRFLILPAPWGGNDNAANTTLVCPTAARSVHELLNLYVDLGRIAAHSEMRARFGHLPSRFVRRLAEKAWTQAPQGVGRLDP